MQSDRNSFCGDVVLDSVNITLGVEDSVLDRIHEMQICSYFYFDYHFFFRYTKIHINISTQTQFYELLLVEYFRYAFSSIIHIRNQNINYKNLYTFACIYLVWNIVFNLEYHVNAIQHEITTKTILIWSSSRCAVGLATFLIAPPLQALQRPTVPRWVGPSYKVRLTN